MENKNNNPKKENQNNIPNNSLQATTKAIKENHITKENEEKKIEKPIKKEKELNVTKKEKEPQKHIIDKDIEEKAEEKKADNKEENKKVEEDVVISEEKPEENQSVLEEKPEEIQSVLENKSEEIQSDQNEKDLEIKKKENKLWSFIKKNKLIFIIVGIVLILGIAATTTVLIVNRHKIFVNDITDFEKSIKNKEIYILQKDIEIEDLDLQGLSIDLNNHTLKINGTFFIDTDEQKTINIGTLKKKEYTSQGKLIVKKADISAADGIINIYSPLTISGDVQAKKFIAFSDITIPENGKIRFYSTTANINKNASGKLELSTSTLFTTKDTTIKELSLDSFSSATIYGVIEIQVDGGKEINFLGNSYCPIVKNVENLYIQQESSDITENINIKNIYFVSQLASPAEINVEQQGNKFICNISEVKNCNLYLLTIKNGDNILASLNSTENETINKFDITEYINNPKEYQITAIASSSLPKIFLPSEPKTISYTYTIKLDSPVLSIDDSNPDTIVLSFPKITFAEKYKIEINGNTVEKDATENDTEIFDITQYVNNVGSYSIKVIAKNPNNSSFIDSDMILISYIRTEVLTAPLFENTDNIKLEKIGNNIKVQWTKVANAKYYVVEISGNENKIISTSTSVLLPLNDIASGTEISVYAQGIGYYNSSSISKKSYVYDTLEQPSTPGYEFDTANNLKISSVSVQNAETYTLYKNGEEFETSEIPSFSIAQGNYANGDSFYIIAGADFYLPSTSDTIIITVN